MGPSSQNTSLEYTTLIQTPWIADLVVQFREFLAKIKNKWIVLAKKDVDITQLTVKDILVIPYGSRFRDGYFRRFFAKFKDAIFEKRDMHFVHLVLTVKPKYFDRAFRDLRVGWNKLHSYFRKKIGWFEYITVIEPHKSGWPHLHVLIFTHRYLIKQKKLSALWQKYGIGKIVWIKRYWAGRWGKQPLFYIAKYLKKYYGKKEWSQNEEVFFAMLWKQKIKTYTCSRYFFDITIKKIKDKKYEFVGVFEGLELEVWLRTFVRIDKMIDDFLIYIRNNFILL